MTLRLRRSELSTPASSPKMMEKAMATAADMVFLDLEDAVAPAQKEAARKNAVDGFRKVARAQSGSASRVPGFGPNRAKLNASSRRTISCSRNSSAISLCSAAYCFAASAISSDEICPK